MLFQEAACRESYSAVLTPHGFFVPRTRSPEGQRACSCYVISPTPVETMLAVFQCFREQRECCFLQGFVIPTKEPNIFRSL